MWCRNLTICCFLLAALPVMAIEEPAYTVEAEIDGIEYRRYSPFVVARIQMPADMARTEAANAAFMILFRYIQGANSTSTKVEMTAPVLQDRGTRIAMTAPVLQEAAPEGWRVAFVLPAEYSLATAPVPDDARIKLEVVPQRLVAALRYSGRWTEKNAGKFSARLLQALEKTGINPTGEIESAFYNAPFVPPFLRRNEMLVTISRLP